MEAFPSRDLGLLRVIALVSLAVFLWGCLDTSKSIQRGDAPVSLGILALGGFLLALSTAGLLDVAARHRRRIEALYEHATRDALTGCWNRAAVLVHARAAARQAERKRLPLAVIMADVDRFKGINDRFGHAAGDAALCEAARRLAGLHPRAIVGRLGGDEFLVVLPSIRDDEVRALAARPSSVLRFTVALPGRRVAVTLSAGAAAARFGTKPEALHRVLRRADRALYAAKSAGRARWVVADAPEETQAIGPSPP